MDKARLDKIKEVKDKGKKDKTFDKLTSKEKDELLKTVCLIHGLIKEDIQE